MSDASAATAPAPVATETATTVAAKPRYDRSIIEGPLRPAVWKIAWPTMLTNVIGGLQGMVDHVLVGNLVGFKANAAIGVSWQIFLVVIVFISSLFTGMSVLVARFAGAGDEEKVNRTVYQAFLTAIFLALGVLAPIGYFVSPSLLNLVNAAPDVKAEALPFLRIMFVFSLGMMVFFMLGGALRSAGDARTPMMLGLTMTVLNIAFNVLLIRGLGPIPAFGTKGAAMGTCIASGLVAIFALARLWGGKWVIAIPRGGGFGPDWTIIKSIFKFGLPTGVQGIAMNVGGVFMLVVHRFARAECRGTGGVRCFVYGTVFVDYVDVGGIDGCGGSRGWSKSRRQKTRSCERSSTRCGTIRLSGRGVCRDLLSVFPATTARDLRNARSGGG